MISYAMGNRHHWPRGVKQLRFEADHSPPCPAKVKNECNYTSTPSYVFMACAQMNLPLPLPLHSMPHILSFCSVSSYENRLHNWKHTVYFCLYFRCFCETRHCKLIAEDAQNYFNAGAYKFRASGRHRN
jgi:hypothetical protein